MEAVIFDYLTDGILPERFYPHFFAGDMCEMINDMGMIERNLLKHLNQAMNDLMPGRSYGSSFSVRNWTEMSGAERRKHLEDMELIYPVEEEIMLTLKSD